MTARSLRRSLAGLAARFERLSLRERLLTTAAVLAVMTAAFNLLVIHRLEARKARLSQQLTAIVTDINDTAAALSAQSGDSAVGILASSHRLSQRLALATRRLHSTSAGLVPPEAMVRVIHDVLGRQRGVALVSLRTLPPYPLLGVKASEGPYVHTVQLVLKGRYLAVLGYLQALQGLPWRFYWQDIDIDASHPPNSIVRVQLGTVSVKREWIEL